MGKKEVLKERRYGKHSWISIADEKYDPVEDRKIEFPTKRQVLEKYKGKGVSHTKGAIQGVMRNRWRATVYEARKRGYDGMPWEVYKDLWTLYGPVEVLEGVEIEPARLQKKFYSKDFRCVMVRIDESRMKGFSAGNVAVVCVDGPFRNHRNKGMKPEYFQVLTYWQADDTVVAVDPDSDLHEELVLRLLDREMFAWTSID